jgi:photosystem II stability/assembly factor-like uncharacterized protein
MQAVAMVAVVAITLGTVGVLLMSRVGLGGPTGGTRYTVIAMLMADERGPFRACTFAPLPSPPIGCYGVDITNIDAAAIPGVVVFPNGTVEVPPVKLVGTWDPRLRAMRLTEAPVIVDRYASTPPKVVAQAPPPPSGKKPEEVLNEITRDAPALQQRGIALLEWGQDSDGVEVELAVADTKSVQYLYDTYGRMKIKGWLQPAGGATSNTRRAPSSRATLPTMTSQLIAPTGNVVWAFSEGFLFRSMDRGNIWEQRPPPPIQQLGGAPEFFFLDAQQGWYLTGGSYDKCNGSTQIWHTLDGGSTWRAVPVDVSTLPFPSPTWVPECKQSLSFIDPAHGFVSTWAPDRLPKIYRTGDGGKTWLGSPLTIPWDPATTGIQPTLHAGLVKRFGSALYVVVGDQESENATKGQYIYRSTDGGITWSWMTSVPTRYIVMVTESRWLQFLVGERLETTTSGQQWHVYESDFSANPQVGGPRVAFGDSLVGYAEANGSFLRTVDGGSHWTRIKTPGVYQP